MDTIAAIHRKLSDNKRLIAGSLFLALVVGVLLAGVVPSLWPAAALAFLAALLSVVFDIHRQVGESTRFFHSINDAWSSAKPEVEKALSRKSCEICWLGVTLSDAWPRLSEVLREMIRRGAISDVTIRVSQVDPSFLSQISDTLSGKAEIFWKDIEDFKKQFEEQLSNSGIRIVSRRYSYMPNYHGILINRSRLFLSTAAWDGQHLLVAEQPYELWDSHSDIGQHKLQVFLGWLDKSGVMGDEA